MGEKNRRHENAFFKQLAINSYLGWSFTPCDFRFERGANEFADGCVETTPDGNANVKRAAGDNFNERAFFSYIQLYTR